MYLKTADITLLYTCPDCAEKSEQPLTSIVQDGTHTCDCGMDMELEPKVRVKYKYLFGA